MEVFILINMNLGFLIIDSEDIERGQVIWVNFSLISYSSKSIN